MINQFALLSNSGGTGLKALENKRLGKRVMEHRQENPERYSGMQFTRRGSVVDVLTNEFVTNSLTHEMPLTRLRHLQLLLLNNTLNSKVHLDTPLHDLAGTFASEFLELIQSIQHPRIGNASVEALVYGIVSPTHAQSLAGRHLNGGVAA